MATSIGQTEHNKKAVLEALEKNMGIVTIACKTVGIGRTTFYQWCKDDPSFKESVDGIKNVVIDFAESALLKQIRLGNTTAIIFFLKTQGRKRGYVEGLDITSGGEKLPTRNDLLKELEDLNKRLGDE